jgi:hypothetical protein
MEDQVNQNTTRANELQIELVTLQAQMTLLQERRTLDADKSFKSALNHLPRYDGRGGTFRDHLERIRDWAEIEGISDERRAKMAIVFSLQGTARARVRFCGIQSKVFADSPTFAAYVDHLLSVFEPDSERRIATLDFASYKQNPNQDIGDYIAQKANLWRIAYPGPVMPPFDMLLTEVIKGVYSKVIRRMIIRDHPRSEEEMRTAALNAVSAERIAFEGGYAESTSLDGLTSITKQNRSEESGTPMEVDVIRGRCYNCNEEGHYSTKCPHPKRDGPAKPPGSSRKTNPAPGERPRERETRKCHHCKKVGHLKQDCRQLKRALKSIGNPEEDEDEYLPLTSVGMIGAASSDFLGQGPRRRAPQ